MRFYFDESGDFDAVDRGVVNVFGTAGVLVPGPAAEKELEALAAAVSQKYGIVGELHAKEMSGEARLEFVRGLCSFDWFEAVLAFTDNKLVDVAALEARRAAQPAMFAASRALLTKNLGETSSAVASLDRLASMMKSKSRMSDVDFFWMLLAVEAATKALYRAPRAFAANRFDADWVDVTFTFDRKGKTQKLNSGEKFLLEGLKGIFAAPASETSFEPNRAIELPNGWFDEARAHPVAKRIIAADNMMPVDFFDVISVESSTSVGVQAADIVANTLVRGAARSPNQGTAEALEALLQSGRVNCLGAMPMGQPRMAPGVFTRETIDVGALRERYSHVLHYLVDARPHEYV